MKFISRSTKRWFERLNKSKYMLWLLAVISFFETIIIPIPIELVVIPLMAINRNRIWAIASAVICGCLLASIVGYGVGMVLYQSLGVWFIDTMGMQSSYASFQDFFNEYGFISILAVGVLPIPFQVAMITAGLSGYPITLFVLAAVIARGIRYYGLAWLVSRYGEHAERMWKKNGLLTTLAAGLIIIGVSLGMQALAGVVM